MSRLQVVFHYPSPEQCGNIDVVDRPALRQVKSSIEYVWTLYEDYAQSGDGIIEIFFFKKKKGEQHCQCQWFFYACTRMLCALLAGKGMFGYSRSKASLLTKGAFCFLLASISYPDKTQTS